MILSKKTLMITGLLLFVMCNCVPRVTARSPPYFGPNDRGPRTPSQTRLRVETTLDIFLLQLLPFKAQVVRKNVMPNCSKALMPLVDTCYKDYELESKYAIQERGTAEELKIGCCNLWKYNTCVLDSVKQLTNYSIRACNKLDIEAVEEILDASDTHPRLKFMCSDYHKQSFYCATFIETSLTITLLLILGLAAIVISVVMSSYLLFLSTVRPKFVYLKPKNRRCQDNDDIKLLERTVNF